MVLPVVMLKRLDLFIALVVFQEPINGESNAFALGSGVVRLRQRKLDVPDLFKS